MTELVRWYSALAPSTCALGVPWGDEAIWVVITPNFGEVHARSRRSRTAGSSGVAPTVSQFQDTPPQGDANLTTGAWRTLGGTVVDGHE